MTIEITSDDMLQIANCAVQGGLLFLVFFFWGIASRRWGRGIDTSLHPMKGSSGVGVNIFFAVITTTLIGAIILVNFVF